MMRKWVAVAALLVQVLAIGVLLHLRLSSYATLANPVSVSGFVSVAVDNVVYQSEMHSFTIDGANLLGTLLSRFTFRDSWGPNVPACFLDPYRMTVGFTSGGAPGVSNSSLSKSYGWNSTHMWFYITGSFVAESSLTLKWVSLVYRYQYMDAYSFYSVKDIVVFNQTLPDIPVPQGSVYSITIAIVWRDGGAFTENMIKHLWMVIPEAADIGFTVKGRDGNFYLMRIYSFPPPSLTPWGVPSYDLSPPPGSPRMFLIISNRSNPPPPSRLDYDMPEIARYPVSYVHSGKGIAFSATVGFDATEVGLVAQFMDGYCEAFAPYTNCTAREILLMRWVPPQPLRAGTTVTVYLLPP